MIFLIFFYNNRRISGRNPFCIYAGFLKCGKICITQNLPLLNIQFSGVKYVPHPSPGLRHLPTLELCTQYTIAISFSLPTAPVSDFDHPKSTYKWNHATFSLLHRAYFTQHNVARVHSCCSMYQNFVPSKGWIVAYYFCIQRSVYPCICLNVGFFPSLD